MAAEQDNGRTTWELPVLPLLDAVAFPRAARPFEVAQGRVAEVLDPTRVPFEVVAFLQEGAAGEEPSEANLRSVGVVLRVLRVAHWAQDGGSLVVFAEGVARVKRAEMTQLRPYLRARVELLADVLPSPDAHFIALQHNVRNVFIEVVLRSPTLSNELAAFAKGIDDPVWLADFVAATLPSLNLATRQQLLETTDVAQRLRQLADELVKERENLLLQAKLQDEVRERIGHSQREFFLREQLKAIQRELGEVDDTTREIEELRGKIQDAGMPPEVLKEANRELERLQQIPAAAAEYAVARTYLDWLVAMPWNLTTAEDVDIAKAAQILDEDHYDLEKVKSRVLEYLAVYQLKQNLKGPILCFAGPPGVGKTAMGKSIARALGRRFVRISLGGIHDDAEIRGHRRTYVGALPGQIAQGLRRVGSRDPVFMLDEVDKMVRDFHGDPASALLEVLDPEQNNAFRDHYLDVPLDLSQVLFITTANLLEPVPPALRDRMEVIELPGYTDEEKLQIAQRFLVARQIPENGLQADKHIRFTEAGLRDIIRNYTHEAGVRNLERAIAAVCRKQARQIASHGAEFVEVTPEVVRERLGAPRVQIDSEIEERCRKPGVALGLAWTAEGGEVIFIEAVKIPNGKGEFLITGQIGQVMQESARATLSWLRANGQHLGIDMAALQNCDIHLHVPAGAVAKDGPSAGSAMATALYSLFTDRPVLPRVAVTGEITLSGAVLAVGGIKAKVLAAKRAGVRTVILPEQNAANVAEDVPPHLREGMEFQFVHGIEDVLALAVGPRGET